MSKRRKRTNKDVPAKGRLREMADDLWSLAVKEDWANKCAVCGKTEGLNSHHLVPRQHEATRYELRNGICLCTAHHIWDADISPHQNAAGWLLWLKQEHHDLAEWYEEYPRGWGFDGTKNAAHYIEVIQSLREYVPAEEFERICGVKFSRWLEEQE